LQRLIEEALKGNYDLRVAVERIEEARARRDSTESFLYPELSATYRGEVDRVSRIGLSPFPAGTDRDLAANFLVADFLWEADFWGRIRRGIEAAEAEVLATEEDRKFVSLALVADLARAYYELLELDEELRISRETLAAREESLGLVQARLDHGVASQLEVDQAASLVHTAAGRIPLIEQARESRENEISILLGRDPGPVERGEPLGRQDLAAQVPAGVPSSLLERRPDIRSAEQQLVAANARIGVARAAYFPRVTLTAFYGGEAEDFTRIAENDAQIWQVAPQVTVPIFTAGRLDADVRAAESQQRQALLRYRKAVQQGFREVSDALSSVRRTAEYRVEQERLRETLAGQAELSRQRYFGGVTSYLEVLDTDRQLFDAELGLAQARRDELLAVVGLYRALGGGWQD
jgi:multidrug efflux system outer membrane protein